MSLTESFKKVVFLLGAGASMDAGCKSSSEMLVDLKERIKDIGHGSKYENQKKTFGEIYDFIIASLNYHFCLKEPDRIFEKNLVNIEDFVMILRQLIDKEFIVPYPLVGNWNDKVVRWEIQQIERSKGAIEEKNIFQLYLEFIIENLLDKWTKFRDDDALNLVSPIRNLLSNSESFELNVFSLNYDLIFENSFNTESERLLQNGFFKHGWSGFDEDPSSTATKLNYFKLHGSLDWQYDEESQEVRCHDKDQLPRSPLIIFGSDYKMLSFDPFLSLLSSFRQKLSTSSIYVIIGYSFHDKYINNLIIQQLMSSPDKKMIVVDPKFGRTENANTELFVKTLERIQKMKSISDILNFHRLNKERVALVGLTAKSFFQEYFGNNAEKLIKTISENERESEVF